MQGQEIALLAKASRLALGAHSAPYAVVIEGAFSKSKVAGAGNYSITPIYSSG